jgi:hypothetical protein
VGERERERERDTAVFAHESALLLNTLVSLYELDVTFACVEFNQVFFFVDHVALVGPAPRHFIQLL